MMLAVSRSYGYFILHNAPIISNEVVLSLVNKYMELMPVHHVSILTILNVDNKMKDKRNIYLLSQYKRLSFWMILSTMQSRHNKLFTWWANISTAARYGAKNDSSASFSEAVYFWMRYHT